MFKTYEERYKKEIVDLILHVQNSEFELNINIDEQSDILDIPTHYLANGGNFWVALNEANEVIGSIGLQQLTNDTYVLKKFFIYKDYRGKGYSVGLFNELVHYAKSHGIRTVILDTPAIALRSHRFYEKNGFKEIAKPDLPVPYAYPDRFSLLYRLNL
ncbi:GNAT family N-acetyltransferase [Paenibacillus sacheonensis]|uniref:GNAT family N-acetyltransferase n=1 Tax=Paenibacillus sacheonensis TaxID=742054 RepID=A0A7X4YUG5_9BACL|nr:GNAT family N-acetyltransferase [Paenibacillus sacheonensis]MBM7569047.1 RimJ/RimL family protein N-acetyltransferase [Paenibacillus sacheonensis]NBC72773.1 GNAT family N-acetyltransferase [Paenibacillus sacheonensis]